MAPDFEKIYDEFAPALYRFIYYKTYNRELAQDLCSTAFLKSIEKQDQYRSSKGSVESWLFTIARNLICDHYRKEPVHLNVDDIWDIKSDENVEVDVVNRSLLEELRKHLSELKAEQRDVIIMRLWLNRSYKEIAQSLGRSEAALKMLFSRTIKLLKSRMTEAELLALLLLPLTLQLKEYL